MKKLNVSIQFILIFLLASVLFSKPAGALTVSAPAAANVSQNVSVSVSAALIAPSAALPCPIEVNFGDSALWAIAGICTPPAVGSCTLSTTHAYSLPGTFTISGRTQPGNINCTAAPYAPPNPATTSITVASAPVAAPTTDAAAPFEVRRLELSLLNNQRGEMTVPRNTTGLKAGVVILYRGSGLLRGYWEADGRIIGRVFQHITYGSSITLQMPQGQTLPTFDPGAHSVRFVLENPAVTFDLPSLVYFVTPDDMHPEVKLNTPRMETVVPYAPLRFEWEGMSAARVYLITFTKKSDDTKVFSAYSPSVEYILPELALEGYFVPGQTYEWEVSALDGNGNLIVKSIRAVFSFQKR